MNTFNTQNIYYVEVTDTFGGESNYSWVNRFKVHAKSSLGAIRKVSQATGYKFRKVADYGDMIRYDASHAAVCAFLEDHEYQAERFTNVVSL